MSDILIFHNCSITQVHYMILKKMQSSDLPDKVNVKCLFDSEKLNFKKIVSDITRMSHFLFT